MKLKEKIKIIDFPIYNYKVYVVVTSDIYESRDKRNEEIGSSFQLDGAIGLHSYNPMKPESYIFLYYGTDIGVISHECYHVIHRMFGWIGAEFENETTAYHLGYLTKEVYDFVNLSVKKKEMKEKYLCPECAGTGVQEVATEDTPIVFCPICKGIGEVYE